MRHQNERQLFWWRIFANMIVLMAHFLFQSEEEGMTRKSILYTFFALLVVASMVLSGCGGAKTTPVAVANTPGASQVTQPPVSEKKVATLIFTQEFDNLSPLYSSMWFTWTTWQMFDH